MVSLGIFRYLLVSLNDFEIFLNHLLYLKGIFWYLFLISRTCVDLSFDGFFLKIHSPKKKLTNTNSNIIALIQHLREPLLVCFDILVCVIFYLEIHAQKKTIDTNKQ